MNLSLLLSEWPKLDGVLAVLSAVGLRRMDALYLYCFQFCVPFYFGSSIKFYSVHQQSLKCLLELGKVGNIGDSHTF